MQSHGAPPAPPALRASPIAILGIPIDPVTLDDAVRVVADMVRTRQPRYAVTVNVDFVVQARTDPELRRILFDAHLVLCDGMPLLWASHLLGNPLPERVAGSDLVPRLLTEAVNQDWRVFFLGGSPASADQAAAQTLTRHPRLRLVGAYSPPFRSLFDMDHTAILSRIANARPDLLLVAFGCPKQEKWINMHYRHLGVPFSMGVGATIDFLAGTQIRAPHWMRHTGTEWVHRLFQDPRRLARRYGTGAVVFSRAILAQARELRSRPRRSASPRPILHRPTPVASVASDPAHSAPKPASSHRPCRTLTAPSRLDAVTARSVVDAWTSAIEHESVVIDLHATTFVDSTGVGLLARLQKTATERHHQLVLARANPQPLRALALMRLDGCFVLSPELPAELPAEPTPPETTSGPQPTPEGLRLAWFAQVTAPVLPTLAEASAAALESLAPGTRLHIDLSQVTFIDSAGLSFMVSLKKRAWRQDVDVTYAHPTPETVRLLQLTQLAHFLLGPRPPGSPNSTAPRAHSGTAPPP